MAVELATAYISLVPSTKGIAGQISKEMDAPIRQAGDKQGSRLGNFLMGGIKKTGVAAAAVAGTAITGALVKGWGRLTAIDDAQAKLRGLGHSTESIATIMESALASVKGTAFGLGDAASLAATAVAAGIKPGKELTGYLSLVGDTATIAGVGLGEIGSILNKTTTAQKVYTAELNQLADRGLPVFQWLQEAYGVNAEELRKMVAEGKIDATRFREILQENIGGAALESGNTVRGAMANVGAALGRVGASLLSGVFPKLAPMFTGLIGVLDKIAPAATVAGQAIGDGLGRAVEWISKQDLSGWFSMLSAAAREVVETVRRNWPQIKSIITQVLTTVQSIITGVVTTVTVLWNNFGDNILAAVQRVWPNLRQIIEGALTVIRGVIQTITSLIQGDWSGVWDGIKAILSGAWELIQGIVKAALEQLRLVIGVALEVIGSILKAAWDAIANAVSTAWNAIASFISSAWETIKTAVSNAIASVKDTITETLDGIKAKWDEVWGAVKTFVSGIWDDITGKVSGAVGAIRSGIESGLSGLKAVWDGIWNPIRDAFVGVWDTIESTFNRVVGAIKTAWNGLANFWNSKASISFGGFDPPGPGPTIPGFSLSLPKLPLLAKGTKWFPGGFAIVGEDGPEAVELPRGARVYPHRQTMQMASDLGGQSQVVENHITLTLDGEVVARVVNKVNERRSRAGRAGLAVS